MRQTHLFRFLEALEYMPISSLVELFSDPKEDWQDEDYTPTLNLPVGIVLRRADGPFLAKWPDTKYDIIGDQNSGTRSNGCSCCSSEWKEKISDYDGWSWLRPVFAADFKK